MSSLEILNGGADQLCGIINECAEHGFTSEYIDMNHLRETEPASLTDGEIVIPLKFVEKGTKNKLGLKLTLMAMELGEVAKWLRSDRESEEVPISGDVRNSRPTDSGF